MNTEMIRYLLDENTHGALAETIVRYCVNRGSLPLDILRVGDLDAPSYGTLDLELLIWAETAERIIVTDDLRTMPDHLLSHLSMGQHLPGIFLRRPGTSLLETAEWLVTIANASQPEEYTDCVTWIPL